MLLFVSPPDLGDSLPVVSSLRSRREAAGLSLRAFAESISYSASHLSRVETGKLAATPDISRRYAALGSTKAEPTAKRASASSRPRAQSGPGLGITCFGGEVLRLRLMAKKSLRSLGADVHLSHAQLGKIEKGEARGSFQLAQSLDAALDAGGGLRDLFLEECARVVPLVPDIDILSRGDVPVSSAPVWSGTSRLDPADRAAVAGARLYTLRVRSHQAGPYSIIDELSDEIGSRRPRPRTEPTCLN